MAEKKQNVKISISKPTITVNKNNEKVYRWEDNVWKQIF